jgi:hypothetical protein
VFHVLLKKIIEPVVILAQMSRVHCFESLVVVDTVPRALFKSSGLVYVSNFGNRHGPSLFNLRSLQGITLWDEISQNSLDKWRKMALMHNS